MQTLRTFYKTSLSVNKYFLIGLFLLLAFLGFFDASYLTILHYKNVIPPCSFAHGCETVLTSKYATLFNIPVALFGSIFYLTLIILLGLFWQAQSDESGKNVSERNIRDKTQFISLSRKISDCLLLLTTSGLLVGLFLVYLQAFVIHAFCQYCLASEVIDFLLFDCAWWLWRRTNRN